MACYCVLSLEVEYTQNDAVSLRTSYHPTSASRAPRKKILLLYPKKCIKMIRARERSQYGITNTDAACIISTAPAHATSFSTICTMRTNECDELDLHQRHQHALDCIKRYEIIFSNLQGNLYSRDERIET